MTDNEKYEAVINNDASYDGIFFYAVKTTGIYCRPSCKSKPPKRNNICFYDKAEDAVKDGFRPCKRCRSDLLSYEPMKEIALQVKEMIDKLFAEVVSLNDKLGDIGISQKRMVEIFKDEYGMTPKSYTDTLRLQEAERLLKDTDNQVIDIAYSVGFSSISAFYRFFKEKKNISPNKFRKENKRGEPHKEDKNYG